ncbi:MAG: DUF465 domain-containing protein [Sphingomonadales bacterium]
MRVEGHLLKLQEKHANLERTIAEENLRPAPNTGRITELKRMKLKLKEQISNFSHAH